jgi:SAM-dependent methyltransferase
LIELGAGSGWLTARWAALGLHCVAVDISADLKLDLSPLVMSREGVFFDRLMADMTNLPIRTGAMDWVFVSASLHHAASLSDSLREAARVLAPEGTLVVINEPMHGLVRRSGKRFVDQAAEETPGLHERSFTYLQWRRALRSAGVRPEFMFPAYYQAILSGTASLPVASRRFAWLAQVAWRSRLRGLLLSRPVQTAARVLLGLNVCMMARKTGDS